MFDKLNETLAKKAPGKKFMQCDLSLRDNLTAETQSLLREIADALGGKFVALHVEDDESCATMYHEMGLESSINMYESVQNRILRGMNKKTLNSLSAAIDTTDSPRSPKDLGAISKALSEAMNYALHTIPDQYRTQVMDTIKSRMEEIAGVDVEVVTDKSKKEDDLLGDLLK